MATLFTDPRPLLLPIPAAVQVAGERAQVEAQARAAMWAEVRQLLRYGPRRDGQAERRRSP